MSPLQTDSLPAEEFFKHEKPGIRYYLLLKQLPRLPDGVANRPYIEEMDRILSGLYDRACSIDAGKTIARKIPNSRLVIFEDSAHMFYVEESEKFLQSMLDFLG